MGRLERPEKVAFEQNPAGSARAMGIRGEKCFRQRNNLERVFILLSKIKFRKGKTFSFSF